MTRALTGDVEFAYCRRRSSATVRTAKRYFAVFSDRRLHAGQTSRFHDRSIRKDERVRPATEAEDEIWRAARDAGIVNADEEEPIDSEIEEDFDDLGVSDPGQVG
jgi:hypothetical protein